MEKEGKTYRNIDGKICGKIDGKIDGKIYVKKDEYIKLTEKMPARTNHAKVEETKLTKF